MEGLQRTNIIRVKSTLPKLHKMIRGENGKYHFNEDFNNQVNEIQDTF